MSNVISSIDDQAFAGTPTARRIYLGGNQLGPILRKQWFAGLPNLQTLSIYGNQFNSLEDGCFQNLTTLRYIDLHGNDFTIIRKSMFSGLPNLYWLSLYGNHIHTIEIGSFEGTALTKLYLYDNDLVTLSQCMFGPCMFA